MAILAFDADHRADLLADHAGAFANVALETVTREYPHMPWIMATEPGPYPLHRDSHPAFYGSFDWHSCVEMVWTAVRVLRLAPDRVDGDRVREVLEGLLTGEHLRAETAYMRDPAHRGFERPYGWAWLLMLQHELYSWGDEHALRWAAAIDPLAELLASRFADWLGQTTYPQRGGLHGNTAFAMARTHAFATAQHPGLLIALERSARRWFLDDVDYPAHYEPSGTDFLSPAVAEAELMAMVLPDEDYGAWLTMFLPGLEQDGPHQLTHPVALGDRTDGQLAHLHGLNLSRAAGFIAMAGSLPPGDPRIEVLHRCTERHAEVGLPSVVGGDYMTEHWLAAYATLLLGHR